MTSRERFHETMRFGTPDRVLFLEEGIREDVLKSWYRQGLTRKTILSDLFKTDNSCEIDLDFDPLSTSPKRPTTHKELSLLKKSPGPRKFISIIEEMAKRPTLIQKERQYPIS